MPASHPLHLALFAAALALLRIMDRLNREHHCTFIFSTHDPRVMNRAHRIVHMVDGQIERDERRDEVPA